MRYIKAIINFTFIAIVKCLIYYEANDIVGEKTNYLKNISKITCLLKCERSLQCDNILYEDGHKGIGNCWFIADSSAANTVTVDDEVNTSGLQLFVKVPDACDILFPCARNYKCEKKNKMEFTCSYNGPGSSSANAASSCLRILTDNNGENKKVPPSAYYWITIMETATRMFCDLITDGGGWTLIANITTSDNVDDMATHTKNDPLTLNEMETDTLYALDSVGLKLLKKEIKAHQLRIFCYKPSTGKTIHLATKNDTEGYNVLQYYSDESSTIPGACNTFDVLPDDTSFLSSHCSDWKNSQWSRPDHESKVLKLYDYTMYITYTAHVRVNGHNRECDDFNSPHHAGVWMYYVR